MGMVRLGMVLLALSLPALAWGQDSQVEVDEAEAMGSRVVFEPLPAADVGMRLGGGLAGILPYVLLDVGVGVGGDVDVGLKYEGVVGLAHIFGADVRWSPLEVGAWRFGGRLSLDFLLFGLQGEKLNLTSTLYIVPELGASVSVTRFTELVMWVACELDVLEHQVVDDTSQSTGTFRYDATIVGFGVQTELSAELDFFSRLRVRIPTETFQYEDVPLYFLPFLEAGAAWSF